MAGTNYHLLVKTRSEDRSDRNLNFSWNDDGVNPLTEVMGELNKAKGENVALKSYYDASGKHEDLNARIVTLAGYAARAEVWTQIEVDWGSALELFPNCPKSKHGSPYFHSKEAMHGRKGYKGWDAFSVAQLILGLHNVLGKHEREDLIGFSCSINLDGYKKFKAVNATSKTYQHICIDHCIGNMFRLKDASYPIEIIFDRGEAFEPVLKACWDEEVDGERTWWADEVVSVTHVDDSRDVCGLQAADLLAWLANRYHTRGPSDQWGGCFATMNLLRPTIYAYFDEQDLHDLFDEHGHYLKGYERTSQLVNFM